MLVAKDELGRVVAAYNKTAQQLHSIRQKSLFCPDCKERVILKAGPIITPHFAHLKHSHCTNYENESEAHLKGKLHLYEWFKKQNIPVSIEHYLPSIKQRADLLIKVKKKYVAVEYQCAPISINEIIERTNGFLSLGIIPIWIFGSSYLSYFHNAAIKLNTVLKAAIHHYSLNKTSKLIFYEPFKRQFTIGSNFYLVKNKGYCHLVRKQIMNITWPSLFKFETINDNMLFRNWLKEKKNFRSQQRVYQAKADQRFLQQLYNNHLHPQNLPSVIHLPVQNSHMYVTPHYIWQSKIVLNVIHPLNVGENFKWGQVWSQVKDEFKQHIQVCYPTPQNHPAYQFLCHLITLGYLRQTKNLTFIKIKSFKFHKTLNKALADDELYLRILLNKRNNSFKKTFYHIK